jgi:putative ABC transport system ATP-binding protein
MIEVASLTKRYDDGRGPATHALDDVSLSIDPAEFMTIVGTSGSGKTTLLNIIGGLDRDYTGTVTVDDSDNLAALPESRLADLRNRRFGFIFQQFHLLDHLTATENVSLPGFFGTVDGIDDTRNEARSRAQSLLERVGLGDRADDHPDALSGGQRQRVAIARALFHRPRYLLCDEPTGSLDRKTGQSVMSLFERLNRTSDVSVIIVTHEAHVARRTRRRVQLEDGAIVADDPVEEIEADPTAELVATEGASTHPGATDSKREPHEEGR